MTTLLIKDLTATEELDRKAMGAVRGGYKDLYKATSPYDLPYFDVSKSSFGFDATQSLAQGQSTVVNNGNNVAFASGITANVNPSQHGTNNINFG